MSSPLCVGKEDKELSMLNGIIILENGEVQQFGTLSRGDLMIKSLESILTQLKQQEKESLLARLQELNGDDAKDS